MTFAEVIFSIYFLCLALSSAQDKLTLSPGQTKHVKFVGDSFFVSCKAKGRNVQRVMWTGPENRQITNYQSSPVQQSKRKRIHVDAGTSGQPGVDLYNLGVEMKDRGNYTCSANVDGKEVQKGFQLIVYKVADFTGTPKDQFLEEGTNSTLQCNVAGDPPPRITWMRNQIRIKTKNQSKYKIHPDNKDWLIVHNVSLEDGGNYTCRTVQLNTHISELKTFIVNVNVNHKPFSPIKQFSEYFSFITGVVNLTCEAVAQPQAKFTWLKDNIALNSSDIYEIFDESHKSVLQISVEDDHVFGDYNCKAQNNLGTYERVVTLEKGKQPAIPHTEIKERKENSFVLKIHSQNQPEMPIVAYKVEFKRPGDDWKISKVQNFKSGTPYTLTGLKADTLYVIRASAQNIAGLSDPSPEILKKTLKLSASSSIQLTVPLNLLILSLVCLLVKLQLN